MANFLDEDLSEDTQASDVNDLDQQEEQGLSQVDEGGQENPETQAQSQEEDDVPEKYRGKSAKEIARMHQEAEKALGRQGSEVGELRRLVDDFIKAQTVAKTQQQAPDNDDTDDVDFFADPKAAISKAIEKHPKIKAAEDLILSSRKAEALNTLKTQHPDFQEIVQSPDFAEWVGKSKVRQELFVRADQAYDFDAANELLSTFKERKAVVEKTKAVEQVERKQAVKAASTGAGKGSGETIGKKTYRRADIIDLMMRNPDRYAALSDEIMAAYAEGRVK
jgi:hypothetical protein